MPRWIFVTDLHGRIDRYERLFAIVERERPTAVLMGGDLLPHARLRGGSLDPAHVDFVNGFLGEAVKRLRRSMGPEAPRILLILGNDDARIEERSVIEGASRWGWEYLHGRTTVVDGHAVYGYSFVPPTPFRLKDWERFDVSGSVGPGSVSPLEGFRTVEVDEEETRSSTIADDLGRLASGVDLGQAVFLFHSPPHGTCLDRAALDGFTVDGVQVDPHVGSKAMRRFIEDRQPLLTLHGHIHESVRITGRWREMLGRTLVVGGAHDGPELAVVRLDPGDPAAAFRELA